MKATNIIKTTAQDLIPATDNLLKDSRHILSVKKSCNDVLQDPQGQHAKSK